MMNMNAMGAMSGMGNTAYNPMMIGGASAGFNGGMTAAGGIGAGGSVMGPDGGITAAIGGMNLQGLLKLADDMVKSTTQQVNVMSATGQLQMKDPMSGLGAAGGLGGLLNQLG